MFRNLHLSPTLFIILETLILLPSILFVLGLLLWFLFHNPSLYFMVISKNVLQNIGVTIISPLSGGFLAYQYLERFHPTGYSKMKAKGILAYSILEIGLVAVYFLLQILPR